MATGFLLNLSQKGHGQTRFFGKRCSFNPKKSYLLSVGDIKKLQHLLNGSITNHASGRSPQLRVKKKKLFGFLPGRTS